MSEDSESTENLLSSTSSEIMSEETSTENMPEIE